MLFIKLANILSLEYDWEYLFTYKGFRLVLCFIVFSINLFTYLMFNLSYITDYRKTLIIPVILWINTLPIYNLATFFLRLLLDFQSRRFKNKRQISFKLDYIIKFDHKEMVRNYLAQEIVYQTYFLLFVWANSFLLQNHHSYGKQHTHNFR